MTELELFSLKVSARKTSWRKHIFTELGCWYCLDTASLGAHGRDLLMLKVSVVVRLLLAHTAFALTSDKSHPLLISIPFCSTREKAAFPRFYHLPASICMDVAKCMVDIIDRIALQARCKKHSIEVLHVFSKYYKEKQHNSTFPLFTIFWCCLHVTEGSRVEASQEIKQLWDQIFGKDVFPTHLAADSCTTDFSVCTMPERMCKKI